MGFNVFPVHEEERRNRGIATTDNPYYGTFQGVANCYPSPNPPLASYGGPHADCQGQGQGCHVIPVHAVAERRPVRERRLPYCGLGLGWFFFVTGFFFGGVPWYIGAFILECVPMDDLEESGLFACKIASLLVVIAVLLYLQLVLHIKM